MDGITATEARMRYSLNIDLRRRRAESLAAACMQKISQHVDHDAMRDIHRELLTLFFEEGVEVLTDRDRAEAGLPQRDNEGWTAYELAALEQKRLEALMRPISFVMPAMQQDAGR